RRSRSAMYGPCRAAVTTPWRASVVTTSTSRATSPGWIPPRSMLTSIGPAGTSPSTAVVCASAMDLPPVPVHAGFGTPLRTVQQYDGTVSGSGGRRVRIERLNPDEVTHFRVRELGRAVTTARVLGRAVVSAARPGTAPRPVRAARAVRDAFEELGPTYVKLAQLVASSPGLFPDVLADELRSCLDRVPPVPYPDVVEVIESDLGAHHDELFASFDVTPIASASIAQVHAATL